MADTVLAPGAPGHTARAPTRVALPRPPVFRAPTLRPLRLPVTVPPGTATVTALGLGAALTAAPAVLARDLRRALRRRYLANDPGFLVEATLPGPAATAEPPVQLVMLGDSLVAGVGAPTIEGSLPILVARRVAEALGRDVHVVGLGVAGARTEDLLIAQVPKILDGGVDVVAIVVGPNDVVHRTPPARVRTLTVALLAAAEARSGAPVVLGGNPHFGAVRSVTWSVRTLGNVMGRPVGLAQRGAVAAFGDRATFVDMAATAGPRFRDRPEAISADGFHPSPIGYAFLADALAPAVVAALQPAPVPQRVRERLRGARARARLRLPRVVPLRQA